ncbi:hypothetical protein B9479_001754 [Cryptococcus floricola]|uniref:Phospholipase B1, membrane-associated n=1 Tax=Cryptococcus floricola TaxID=2591691 RepID=A0A5D3B345_9TREE|nr:hypothetical protein B9479_001754 [Cryptococcus floricola]
MGRYKPIRLLLLALSVLIPLNVWSLPPHLPHPNLPGKFVRFSELDKCPDLPRRETPKSAKDVRPDDIRVVMALGDSISAGLLARPSRTSSSSVLPQIPFLPKSVDIQEYRGVSYPIGSDPGAVTIPNILSHFITSSSEQGTKVQGGSTGHHPPVACLQSFGVRGCMPRPDEDGLNAAISGSVSASLLRQAEDLLPRLSELGLPKEGEWAYLNLGIGANDICAFCLSPNISLSGDFPFAWEFGSPGSPKQFANDIRTAINALRPHLPHLIVNIVGLLRVSSLYRLTLKSPYCQPPLLPHIPHLPLECGCAMIPGPAGDWTRRKMDELGEEYDEAVLELVREWEQEGDDGFGVIWQPGSAIDLESYPIKALSPLDCFHPSEAAHQRVAAGFWNRLTLSLEEKYLPIKWEEDIWVRCLEEHDRFPIGMVSESLQT